MTITMDEMSPRKYGATRDEKSLMKNGGFSIIEARILLFLREAGPQSDDAIKNRLEISEWDLRKSLKKLYMDNIISERGNKYSLQGDLSKWLSQDMTESEIKLLKAIKRLGPGWVKSVDLTKKLGVTQATISESARRLKNMGLMESSQAGYRLIEDEKE